MANSTSGLVLPPATAVIAMTVSRLILIASLSVGSLAAAAQAGDQPFDDVDIITLPSASPDKPSFSLNWTCAAIELSSSQRYRPGHCMQRMNEQPDLEELEVETIGLEQPPSEHDTPRRFR